MAKLGFLRDLQFAQEYNYPTLDINIDRERAGQFGLTMSDVVRSIVPATSSSRFTDPNYWRDPNSGNAFQLQVELPQNRMQSIAAVGSLPVMAPGQSEPQLDHIAELNPGTMPGLIERFNGQHIVSLTANIHGITLGEASPKAESGAGWRWGGAQGREDRDEGPDPAVVANCFRLADWAAAGRGGDLSVAVGEFPIGAVGACDCSYGPGSVVRSLAQFWITNTTLNIQSFMGAIMAIGIAVANSILLVTFAERFRHENTAVLDAAREGASSRLRAILMTAAAMIFGMLPMAIGIGEGGRQSAPLGRAVIGGLVVSTFATLTILPSIYAILQSKARVTSPSLNPLDPESRYYEAT